MEMIDVLDENGIKTGEVLSRDEVHKIGLWHKASGVLIINSKHEILLQLRSRQKEKNGGLWDLSASGHISSGETPEDSLIREIKEEIGVNVVKNELKLLGVYKRQELHNNGKFIENEYDYIYILEKDINISKIKFQKEEVEQIKFVTIESLTKLLDNDEVVKRVGVWHDLRDYILSNNKEI